MDHNNQEQNEFRYTYSAAEQAELKRIRDKYSSPVKEEDKMARLRRLDASVTDTAQAVALVFGIVGALVLGLGMSLVMTDLSEGIGLSPGMAMPVGIAVGVIGGILASLAYPVYSAIVRVKRKQITPEILRLTEELMK